MCHALQIFIFGIALTTIKQLISEKSGRGKEKNLNKFSWQVQFAAVLERNSLT
jgi:hypothetical protein